MPDGQTFAFLELMSEPTMRLRLTASLLTLTGSLTSSTVSSLSGLSSLADCAGSVSLPRRRGLLLDHFNRGRRGDGFAGRTFKHFFLVVIEALLYQRVSAH